MTQDNSRRKALNLFNLKEGYTKEELKKSYLKKIKIYHPDSGGSHEEFLYLQKSYELLTENIGYKRDEKQDEHQSQERVEIHESGRVSAIWDNLIYIAVGYLTSASYLIRAGFTQLLLSGYFLYFNFHQERTFSNVLLIGTILATLLLTFLSLMSIYMLFYNHKLLVRVGLSRLSNNKLYLLRNMAIITFFILTLPGYFTFLIIYSILTIFRFVISLV